MMVRQDETIILWKNVRKNVRKNSKKVVMFQSCVGTTFDIHVFNPIEWATHIRNLAIIEPNYTMKVAPCIRQNLEMHIIYKEI